MIKENTKSNLKKTLNKFSQEAVGKRKIELEKEQLEGDKIRKMILPIREVFNFYEQEICNHEDIAISRDEIQIQINEDDFFILPEVTFSINPISLKIDVTIGKYVKPYDWEYIINYELDNCINADFKEFSSASLEKATEHIAKIIGNALGKKIAQSNWDLSRKS